MSDLIFKSSHRYRQLSEMDDARCCDSPLMIKRLKQLGFCPLGIYEWTPLEELAENPFRGQAGKELARAWSAGQVFTTLVDKEGTTFAGQEFFLRADRLRFSTVLRSGQVIETRRKPDWEPPHDLFADDDEQPLEDPEQREAQRRIEDWINGMHARLIGNRDALSRPSLPRAGYDRTTEALEPEALWALHQHRVAVASERAGSTPVDHRSLPLFLSMQQRRHDVMCTYFASRESLATRSGLLLRGSSLGLPLLGWMFGLHLAWQALLVPAAATLWWLGEAIAELAVIRSHPVLTRIHGGPGLVPAAQWAKRYPGDA